MLELGPHDDLGILLAMAYIAWADDSLARAELDLILEEAADQGLDEAEQRTLRDALLERPTAEAIAARLTTDDARRAALYAGHVTAWADARVERTELQALDALGEALGLDASARADVEQAATATVRNAQHGHWQQALLLEEQVAEGLL